ncbi:uncharacterized protein [Mytilus edulis]|uniref:uncharacterized protein n=1 Tax=Mytilus edulis TaxID=6550 RepID=UPI0039F053E6
MCMSNVSVSICINAIVVALMAIYVYRTERRMEEISDKHSRTETQNDKKTIDNFKQIFVACTGNKQPILDTWKKPSMGGDISNIKDSCTNRHLRSTMIDNWNGSLIDQVKIELLKNGKLAVEIYFDGRGSTSYNWFTRERMQSNSFNDLTQMSTFKYFSMDGHQGANRHFFIHQNFGGCPNDKGWMIIVDAEDTGSRPCMFDKLPGMVYPYLLYGPGRQMAHYDAGLYAVADMMIISIST